MDRAELTIGVRRTADEVTLILAGEIDMLTAARLSGIVNEMLADPPARIEIGRASCRERVSCCV